MLARSPEWDGAVARSGIALSQLAVLNEVDQVTAVLLADDGGCDADTAQSQLRTFTASLGADDDDLVPAGLADLLGPGGCKVQAQRGVWHTVIELVGYNITTQAGWTPTTPVGTLNGVVSDSNGVLTLAWP